MKTNEEAFAEAVELLRNASRLVIFTGAGVSAESGIPTFRDKQTGLWAKFDPAELATASAFRKDPDLVWGWYEWRRLLVAQTKPNTAHRAIAALERHVPELILVTQNVDDLHERAGSSDVIHLHGSLQAARCFACSRPYPLRSNDYPDPLPLRSQPPRCARCNGRVRPGVVWFGEALPEQELRKAFQAAKDSDLLLSVGTSGVVYPAADLPNFASRHGANVIHINTEPVDVPAGFILQGRAGEWLVRLLTAAFGHTSQL